MFRLRRILSVRGLYERRGGYDLQKENSSTDKGRLAGRVITTQGESVTDATVLITGDSPPHKDIGALTNEQGEYRFGDLVPGDYTIMVNAGVHGSQIRQIHVEAGYVARLDFLLPG